MAQLQLDGRMDIPAKQAKSGLLGGFPYCGFLAMALAREVLEIGEVY